MDYTIYQSPFSWRYGSPRMQKLWSEGNKRRLWRQLWVSLAVAQNKAGLTTLEQVEDLRAHQDDVDIDRAHTLEAELQHDLMAEVHTFAEQCPVGGGIIHLGATSMDIEDNADAIRLRDGLGLITNKLKGLIRILAEKVDSYADLPTIAYTHLQPAEPTTVGYRLAQTLQDLCQDLEDINAIQIRGKGLKGAVGTSASYGDLLGGTGVTPRELETAFLAPFDLPAFPITTQTYPRKQDLRVVSVLAQLAQTLYRFAFDVRLLQSPAWGEFAEPFGAKQIGSSAMPFKRNPILSESVDSLGRLLAGHPRVAWDNAAHHLLERTLDDSANRRSILPESFLVADEMLLRVINILIGLDVDVNAASRQVEAWGTFAATERLMMLAAKRGGNRQELHELIRKHSMFAWKAVKEGTGNFLTHSISHDPILLDLLTEEEIGEVMNAHDYVGDAPERAREMAKHANNLIADV